MCTRLLLRVCVHGGMIQAMPLDRGSILECDPVGQFPLGLGWITAGLRCVRLGWVGLDWIRLGWMMLDWVGLCWVMLDWVGFG